MDIIRAYDFCRRHYTTSERVVPSFQNSRSNLSQASLNRDMLQMLDMNPGMTVADLGSGCGITANTFAVFGASKVVGFEFHEFSCQVSRAMFDNIRQTAVSEGLGNLTVPIFVSGAVNDQLADSMKFDRLHGGYMMSKANASKYVLENLNPNGIAVLNVGNGNDGDVVIFRKDERGKVTSKNTGICVIFQEDAKP